MAAGPPAKRQSGRLAIIIDDLGQDEDSIGSAAALPFRLTFAVIPHLPHSRLAAERLNARGHEILLHLPMEPIDYPQQNPGRGAILSRMKDAEVRRTVHDDLAAVPHIRGVNNHMGSRITADPARIRVVLETLASTPYFFIDSRTSDKSVAFAIARELRIRTAERTVFLDAEATTQAVRAALRKAVAIALQEGSAIAIGHPYPVTFEVLRDELPKLNGDVRLVFASELVS